VSNSFPNRSIKVVAKRAQVTALRHRPRFGVNTSASSQGGSLDDADMGAL
jgi:hypothetical protein